ncbi:ABC transporter ATP-binding protein [Paenibacillus sp. LjRoot153]|uniref:ABC transporter ATP-binding protein n=1 Tax=Paenibacillus sp. LjRoot153 TaxID=3342270 RepID=UPI003ECC41A9
MRHVLYFAKGIHTFSGKILYFNLIGMVLISLLESVGIFLLIPLINLTGVLAVNSSEVAAVSWIQKMFQSMPENASLLIILVCYLGLIIGQGYFQRNQTILNAKIQQRYTRHLREETYKAILQANWGFFLKTRKTDHINSLITEISRVSAGTQMFLQLISSLVFTFIQIGMAFWLSPAMTVTVIFFGVTLIAFSRKFIRKSSSIGEQTTQLSKAYLAGVTDHFNGIKEIKSNSLEDSHISWIHTIGKKLEHNIVEMIKLNTTSQFIFKVVSACLMTSFVLYSIKMFQAQPTQLMLIMVIFSRLWPRFSGLQSNLEQLGGIIPSFVQLIQLKNECLKQNEITDGDQRSIEPIRIEREIECRNVFFRYNTNQSQFTLQNINITIPSNQMTAIIGRSGAGKSTLIDLLMGLNLPEKGQVLIDGTPLTSENLLSLRHAISYVPQDPFLFNSTVKENLLLMKPDASEEELWTALRFAAAAEFVKKLPQGLHTLIGDRGIKLSGGERQRLVIARAILKKPSILVLDEATSALDTENEENIQQVIQSLKGEMTIIVIAHRLSTIRNADQVIEVEQGNIIQVGGFHEVIQKKRKATEIATNW